jgi:putative DNA primase/helicase
VDHLDLTATAHDYAKRGWRVIPLHRVGPDGLTCSCSKGRTCTSKGKHPIENAWQKQPRLSAADIQTTWDVERQPNLGIATGADSGFWVLDIDPKGGGMESMAELVAQHGRLPDTTVAQTGSGGYHYLFTLPDFEVRNDQSGRVAQGIDVRGQGGQIVAPPSRTDKGVYTLIQDAPLAAAPQWLLDLVRKEEHVGEIVTAEDLPKPEEISDGDWKRYSAYAQRAITEELARLDRMKAHATERPEDYRGEPWNHTTFEVSCTLIEFANSPWCAYSLGQALRDVLERAPRDREFDEYVIRKTFDSAREKVGPKARQQPEDRRQEPDPLFGGPDVKDKTGGPTGPAEGQAHLSGRTLFGGEQGTTPLYREMALAVEDLGPIGWGVDNDFWSYADGVWKPDHYVVQHRLVDLLGNAYRTAHRTNTSDIVQRRAQRITADPLEHLMNFKNGMLEWRTGELGEHDSEWGSTVQLGTDWNPDVECPRFDAFLHDIMHEDYVRLAWEMIGYLMLSGNPMQVAFLFYGKGGNGKGTLLNVMEMLLGRDNIASESLDDLNGNRFRTANLFGKIANIAGDIDATYQEHTAMFKAVTGEDMITGERKNRDPFRFESWAVPVFSCNKFPGSADVTDGYLRRWIVLHFHKRIPDNQAIDRKVLMAQFREELPGIAARGIESLKNLIKRGYFEPEGEALEAKREFAMAIDQVRQWHTNGGVTAGPEVETKLDDLFAHYSLWADRAGQRKLKMSEFAHRLEGLNYPMSRVGGDLYFKGIAVPKQQPVSTSSFFGGSGDRDEED